MTGVQTCALPISYSYTGQTISIARNRNLSASYGSYTYAGQAADITYTHAYNNYVINAQAGSYTYTGQSADLVKGRVLTASYGTYSIAGQSVEINYAGNLIITTDTAKRLVEIWQRLGLDATAPLSETNLSAAFGNITLTDRKSTRLNSSHIPLSRMPSSA